MKETESHPLVGSEMHCTLIVLLLLGSVIAAGFLAGPVMARLTGSAAGYSLCESINSVAKYGSALVSSSATTPAPVNSQFKGRLPYLEYIPIFPNSTENVDSFINDSNGTYRFGYMAPTDMVHVTAFYSEAFSRTGWKAIDGELSAPDSAYMTEAVYQWDNPDQGSSWHISLNLDIYVATENSTWVTLNYLPYPDLGKNLPAYPDASDITLSCNEYSRIAPGTSLYNAEIKKTFRTKAAPEEVAEYYNLLLPKSGWDYSSDSGPDGIINMSPGNIEIGDGLPYQGGSFYPIADIDLGIRLQIKSAKQGDGSNVIELRVSVTKLIIPNTDEQMR